uniref:Uncharacterized protein n=1 Tax=Knipowitschia caucasica TaxID=637954 RepID=A0AAV2M5E9_KNICA
METSYGGIYSPTSRTFVLCPNLLIDGDQLHARCLKMTENTHPSLSLYLSISNGERNSILIQIQRFPSFFKPILALFVHFLIYIYF